MKKQFIKEAIIFVTVIMFFIIILYVSDSNRKVNVDYSNKEQYDKLENILKDNQDKTVVLTCYGTIVDDMGNGIDENGYYINYKGHIKIKAGRRVKTVIIFTKGTTDMTDFETRTDTIVKENR